MDEHEKNEDVMSFGEEPVSSNVNEPESIPTVEQNKKEISENKEADGEEDYSGWEPADESDFSENPGAKESEEGPDSNEENESDERTQAKKIQDTQASEKIDITKKNEGLFLQRGKLLTIIIGIALVLLIFFSFVVPSLNTKKKKEKSNELDKNGLTVIPKALTNEDPIEPAEIRSNFENGNSALEYSQEEFDKKYPPLFDEKPKNNTAPVQVPSKGSSTTTDVPLTNRNEQQKQIQRLSLQNYDSPTATRGNGSGAHYGENKITGYNQGYNSSLAGQTNGYTPAGLTNNIDKFLATQGGNNQSNWQSQNNQSQKNEFLRKNGIGGNYQWNSDYSIWKGTVISAVLDTGINTDLPGSVMAHVTKNIYSSNDGRYLLIPEGSRLYGEYNSDVSYGQSRVQVVWNTLIRPDGLEVNLGSMNGIDAYGYSGYKGIKTDHPFEYVKAFGLIAMYSILDTKANNLIDTQNNMYAQNAMSDVYSETKRLNNKIVDRALDIQPTNKIKSGTEINLITNVTVDLPPLEPYEVEEKYVLHK
ncbi:MAG: hypothetical protein MJ181_01880 [Treponema sp.]|nr:hypothetical protein [Treponema sp.]